MRHLLFTGASGLLGSQLMCRLLAAGRPLAVLVRSTAKASGRERVEAILAAEEQSLGRSLPRPVVLDGDLTRPQCGLADADIEWVRRSCSAVLHSAASLEFVGADRSGEPWRTNVDGTRRLLELAERAGIDEFHHVSTAYVCGLSPGPIAEKPSDGAHGFRNDYEASKHEAEWLVRKAAFLKQPTFYRPAVIVGDSQTGATTTYHGLMAMLQLMTVIVRNLPADETGFRQVSLRLSMTGDEKRNMIPVDWTAEVIARLVGNPAARGHTIHLAPGVPVTIRQIIDFTSSYLNSGGVEFCGPQKPAEFNETENVVYDGKGLYEAYEQTDPVFETDNLKNFVPDLPCPVIDEQMLHRFLAFGDADRWGKRKRIVPKIEAWIGDTLGQLDADGLVSLARAMAGGPAVSPPSAVGLEVVGPGGGSWTIRRSSNAEARLEAGIQSGVQVFSFSADELLAKVRGSCVPSASQRHPAKSGLREALAAEGRPANQNKVAVPG